ncbi:hypothetical protein PENSPDRAFT_748006 [Peniophora sp. CONT]|nr:hypothetical protein PENSPDRAFT_748006 [Peniophora sp. CONT]
MSSGSRFAFRPFRQSAQEGGAPQATYAQPAASRPPPKLSFFRQPGQSRPKTSAERVVEVKEEPASVEDDSDVFQWSSSGDQSMMPPPPASGQRSRFHIPAAHTAYSPAPSASTDNRRSSFGHQTHSAPRIAHAHVPDTGDFQHDRSGSIHSFGTPAVDETHERGTPSNNLQNRMIMESLAENDKLRANQERLMAELEASREDASRLMDEKAALAKRVSEIKDASKRVVASKMDSLAGLQSSLHNLNAQSRSSFPSAAETRDSLSLVRELRASVKDGIDKMNGLFDEESNLTSVAETRAMISDLQQEHASSREANDLLRIRLTDYSSQLVNANERIRELESKISLNTAALQQARNSVANAEARLAEDKAKIKHLHSEHSDALFASAQAEDKLARLHEQMTSVVAESERKDQALQVVEELRRENAELQARQSTDAFRAERDGEIQAFQEQIEAFQATSARDAARTAELQTSLATRTSELTGLQARFDDLSAQLSSSQAAERKAKDDIQRALERETTARLAQQRLAAEAAAKDEAAAKLEGLLASLRTDIDTARAEAARMLGRADAAQARLEELNAELKTTRDAHAADQVRLSGMQTAHATALDAAISKHTQEAATLRERAANLAHALDGSQVELDAHKVELVAARADAEAAREKAMQADARTSVVQQRFDDQGATLKLLREAQADIQERLAEEQKKHAVALEKAEGRLAKENATLAERADGLARLLEERKAEAAQLTEELVSTRINGDERVAVERETAQKHATDAQDRLLAAQQARGHALHTAETAQAQLDDARAELATVRGERGDVSGALESARAECIALREEIEGLQAEKAQLVEQRQTMHARYKSNELGDEEKTFVDTLLEECQASHEKRLAEKQNELRRRANIVTNLETKNKELEQSFTQSVKSEKSWKRKFEALQQSITDNAAASASTPAQQAAPAPPPVVQSIIDIKRFAPPSSEAGSPSGLAKELAKDSEVNTAHELRLFDADPLSSPPGASATAQRPVTSTVTLAPAGPTRARPKLKKPAAESTPALPLVPAVAAPRARPARPLKPKTSDANKPHASGKTTFGALGAFESDSSPPQGKKPTLGKRPRADFEEGSSPTDAGRPKTRQRSAAKKAARASGEGKKHENAQAGPSTRKRLR